MTAAAPSLLVDPARLRPLLGPLAARFDVDALAEATSSNDLLLDRAARGAPSGSVLVVDRQTAGRGRRGRNWASSPEDSLTFSLLWRFAGPPGRVAGLSLAVGAGLACGLEALGARGVCLKWPNDVLWRDGDDFRKLSGVLVELASDSRSVSAVIGVGLNLRPPPAGTLPQPAAGLLQTAARQTERHAVLAALLTALAGALDRFAGEGFAGLRAEWLRRHAWQDESVVLHEDGSTPLAGRCRGVDDDGALLIETAGGLQRVFSGDVSLRRA